jgi:hypothetical protein
MNLTRSALALGASMRITRLIVADDVPGRWWIKEPLDEWLLMDWQGRLREHEHKHRSTPMAKVPVLDQPWWYKYRDGLDCPFCVGMWVAAGVVISERVTRGTRFEGAWTLVASALTLNESAAHLGVRLGDTAGED